MKKRIKNHSLNCFSVLLGLCVGVMLITAVSCENTAAKESPKMDSWIDLFNGKDLDGWKVKIAGHEIDDNYNNTYRVEDGILKVSYVGDQVPGGPGWAFRNSGIMIHSQSPESMGKDQNFPVSIEVQTLGGDGTHERSTGNLCTPGTNVVMNDKLVTQHCTNSTSDTYHGDQWVSLQVEVHGNELIKHIVNGKTVLEYTQPQLDPKDANAKKLIKDGDLMLDEGYIALQAESHPVEFRKVQIKVLPQ